MQYTYKLLFVIIKFVFPDNRIPECFMTIVIFISVTNMSYNIHGILFVYVTLYMLCI